MSKLKIVSKVYLSLQETSLTVKLLAWPWTPNVMMFGHFCYLMH